MELGDELSSRRGELIVARKCGKICWGYVSRFGGAFAFGVGCFRILGGVFALCGYLFRAQRVTRICFWFIFFIFFSQWSLAKRGIAALARRCSAPEASGFRHSTGASFFWKLILLVGGARAASASRGLHPRTPQDAPPRKGRGKKGPLDRRLRPAGLGPRASPLAPDPP